MKLALNLALENAEKRSGGPFGCVIVKGGEIIATGFNEVLTNNDPTAHAEIVAIRKACLKLKTYRLEGCEIYSSCEPCPMCMGAIYWSRPDKMYYAADRSDAASAGFEDKHIYNELVILPEKREIPGEQLMKEEGKAVFLRFNELELDINY